MVQFFVVQLPNLSDLDLPPSFASALGPNPSPLSLLLGQAQHQRLPDTTRQFPYQVDSNSGSDSDGDPDKGSAGHGLLAFPQRAVSPQALPGYPLTESNNSLALGFPNDFMFAFEKFMGCKLVKGKHTAMVMQELALTPPLSHFCSSFTLQLALRTALSCADQPLREEWEGLRLLIDRPGIILDSETSATQPIPAVVVGSENQPAVHSYLVCQIETDWRGGMGLGVKP
ncbi:hypothetical protein T439DRAFT_332040 [Meredithblackwellia eburnea MCA 4105]